MVKNFEDDSKRCGAGINLMDRIPITKIYATAYIIPTDRPEADGTLTWNSTTLVIVQVEAGGKIGLGYTYASTAAATLINDTLHLLLENSNALDIPACWQTLCHGMRNLGIAGQVAYAIAAIDTALWDLKAKLLNISLITLLGAVSDSVPIYGSGGFTTYSETEIEQQIADWRAQGIMKAKIKIGSDPAQDKSRVAAARNALGDKGYLFVDANGAYTVKQALEFAEIFKDHDVCWFEEPVTSDNLDGLRLLLERAPAGMDIAAGEYGSSNFYFRQMLNMGAVDVLQIDATRCAGYTGFMQAAALSNAANIPISSHCAPSLHLPICAHVPGLLHMEYFYDHVRIENMLFDGGSSVRDGKLTPQTDRPGHGLVFKQIDAERFAA